MVLTNKTDDVKIDLKR